MAAILEKPQCVAYQKHVVVYALFKSVQSLEVLTFRAQWMCLAALLLVFLLLPSVIYHSLVHLFDMGRDMGTVELRV